MFLLVLTGPRMLLTSLENLIQSPFVVFVNDLLGLAGARRTEELSGPLEFETDLVTLVGDARAIISLEAMADGLVARGEVVAPVLFRCNRCLVRWQEDANAEVVLVFGEAVDDEIHPIGRDGAIDLEPFVRDELCLSLPLAPLCSDSCLGLCQTCGTDLNRRPCSGHPDANESPFAALRGFLGPEID